VSDPEQPSGQACGIVNLLIPIFLAGGCVTGWAIGYGYGITGRVLGAGVGFFLGIPVLGVFLMTLLGIAAVADWFIARRARSQPRPPVEPP
jgi:uncharacterized membrane protein required for colicin V production